MRISNKKSVWYKMIELKEKSNMTFSTDKELDFYLKLMGQAKSKGISQENKEIWKNRFIIKIMNELNNRGNDNKDFVKNVLIISIALFENFPGDIYSSLGRDLNQLFRDDREKSLTIIKSEFLPNNNSIISMIAR